MEDQRLAEIILHRMKRSVQRTLPKGVIVDLEVEEYCDRMVLTMTQSFWAETMETERHIVRVAGPATWWDHLKDDCFPDWLLKWFPIKTVVVEKAIIVERKALFPKFFCAQQEPFIRINQVICKDLREEQIQ